MRDLLTALALSPILIPQGIWTALRAARLPEAAGPRVGMVGTGPALRLLVVGDSSAAGVGVDTQPQALGGQISGQLSASFVVDWRVVAASGGTAASTLALLNAAGPISCDVAVVALGVNDAKNGVSAAAWAHHYDALVKHLRDACGAKHIYLSALPDLSEFPLLPWPLRSLLGRRAALLDHGLRKMAEGAADLHYVPMQTPLPTDAMASDGFHPGVTAYSEWARVIASHILADANEASNKSTTL